jgi:hypothetical protein
MYKTILKAMKGKVDVERHCLVNQTDVDITDNAV